VQRTKWLTVLAVWLAEGNLLSQAGQQIVDTRMRAPLDVQREKRVLQPLPKLTEKEIVSAVDPMPATSSGSRPPMGNSLVWVRFGQMVKHLSATNHILGAAALGEEPPADAGDKVGPQAIRTKDDFLTYLSGSFAHLSRAVEAIGRRTCP